jgi:betaine-aldehyde dehydrogenase
LKKIARAAHPRGDLFDESTNFGRWSASRTATTCCATSPKASRKARAAVRRRRAEGEGFDRGAWVAPTVFTDCMTR